MQSTLKPNQADDPRDVVEVAPGVVLVAPADGEPANAEEELSSLLRAAARQHSDPQTRAEPDFSAAPPVPSVDTTFRSAAVGNVQAPKNRKSMGGRAIRSLLGFLLALGIGVGAAAWQAYGDAAGQMIANVSPQRVLASLLPREESALPAQPTPPASEAAATSAAPAQGAPEGVAPATAAASAETAPSLQSMARNLAAAGQEIEQLKASIEQLKASQEQMSRELAKSSEAKSSEAKASEVKSSEPNLRPRMSALPPRPAAPARRPVPSLRPSQAAAPPMSPPASAVYVPRQPEPLPPPVTAPPPADPELSSVPRPPLPVRQ